MSACVLKLSGLPALRIHRKVRDIVETLQSIELLLSFLEREHFTVIGVEMAPDRRMPVVHIANTSRCAWLKRNHKAYNMARTYGGYGQELVWRSDMMGCRVQWIERGH